jgi:hypothetical protein
MKLELTRFGKEEIEKLENQKDFGLNNEEEQIIMCVKKYVDGINVENDLTNMNQWLRDTAEDEGITFQQISNKVNKLLFNGIIKIIN